MGPFDTPCVIYFLENFDVIVFEILFQIISDTGWFVALWEW